MPESELEGELERRALRWLDYGDEDLRLARHALLMAPACPYRLVAYHAQQCAEKHLKAFLVRENIDFPFTHDIAHLLELCAERAEWATNLSDAEELSAYAVTTRYPGLEDEVSEEDALRTLEIAEHVREVVRTAMQAGAADRQHGVR